MSDPLRFFVPAEVLQGEDVVVCGEVYHHLCKVLRIKAGAKVTLLDGKGRCCEVRLEQLQESLATTSIIRRWQETDNSLQVNLLQALPKGDKFDLVLQKGTELGVHSFQPLETAHAIPNLNAKRLEKRQQRWTKIAAEAARQSRRSFLPEVKPLLTLEEGLKAAAEGLKLVLWEAGSTPLAEALPKEPPCGVNLLIGPEGGFSAPEIATIISSGYQAVHLGPRILRTETAGLAATPILQYLYGDWQQSPAADNTTQHEENL